VHPPDIATAQADLGRQLAVRRVGGGLSQAALAPLTGYSRSTVANVETGRQRVPRDFWQRCDQALGCDGELITAFDRFEADRRAAQASAAQAATARRMAFWADSGPPAPGRRARVTEPAPPMAAVQGLTDLVTHAAGDVTDHATLSDTGLGRYALTDLFSRVVDIARGYATRRRADSFVAARSVRDVAATLASRSRRPGELADLYLVAGQTSALMASAAFDLGLWPQSLDLARASRTYADLAGHPSLQAWSLGLLATVLNWYGQPARATAVLDEALAIAPAGVATLRLRHIEARSHALRGDADGTRDALRAASSHVDGGPDPLHDDVGGEFGFDRARAAACAGAAWLALRDSEQAEAYLRRALGPAVTAPAQGALADLAAAMVLRGDLDGAEEAMDPVFHTDVAQRITSVSGRVARVSALVGAAGGGRRGSRFATRIQDWMDAAPALPSAATG
jgi:transcriptional regulator with XRE-family HTH domain